jgi:hypothetical protein
MADNEFAGSALYLQWASDAGTVTLQSDFRNFSWGPTLNFIDATAGADTFERLLPSYGVGTDISLEMLAQTDGTALATALAKAAKGTLTYGPSGTANNAIAYRIPCYSQGVQWAQPFADVVQMNANFRQYAEFSQGVWASGTVLIS